MSSNTSTPPGGQATSEDAGEHNANGHPSLPAFHSIRQPSKEGVIRTESVASSSHSNQTSSRHADHEPVPSSARYSFGSSRRSDEGSKSQGKEKEMENGAPPHQVARNSGGFLLEPVTNAKRFSRMSMAPARDDSRLKRHSADSELSISKRRHRHNVSNNSSFKSSPLSTEVKQAPVVHDDGHDDQLIPGTDIRRSFSSSQTESHLNGSPAPSSRNVQNGRSPMANVAYAQDPAQIVQMALSLSEGRRRLASGRRYASQEQGERRVISTASRAGPRGTVNRKSIAPFMASNRQASRNGSPKGRDLDTSIGTLAAASDAEELNVEMDFDQQISPATAARVEKAKIYFELAHEHRRLLQHLPPIRKPGTLPASSSPEAMQKAYNPLQYVRNRKLRIWEKVPIDSEVDGWHDVEKVRAWVDSVTSSHAETQHDPLECVRLPPLDQKLANTDGEDQDGPPADTKNAASPRVPDQLHPKPTRPRSDWVTHPADVIADAYWLEQGLNKTKIQDRDNNIIYPPHTQFKFSGWRNRTPMDMSPTLQQRTPPPELDQVTSEEPPPSALPDLPTFRSAHHAHKRGSRTGKLRDSLHITDPNSSRERSRIRRKLFRDSSDSESSGSMSFDDADATDRGRRRLRRKRGLSPDHDSHAIARSKSPTKPSPRVGDSSRESSALNSKRSSADHSALNKLLRLENIKKASPLNRSRTRNESSRPGSTKMPVRSSTEQERTPRDSADYDTATAPNSPGAVQWPSIAINLSPPPSRGPSPSRNPISTILHPFHRKPHDKASEQIDTTDFAEVPVAQGPEPGKDGETDGSRGTSPMTRGMAALSRDHTHTMNDDDVALHSSIEPRLSTVSKVTSHSTAHGGNDHSRFRGIFKGGRIAELVGNEVSKVGDFIWKRDAPSTYRHKAAASEASLRSYKGSESEKEVDANGTVLRMPPPTSPRSRSSTISSGKSERALPTTKTALSDGRPRYNNPNLPSFTSPFQRDREQEDRKQGHLTPDGTDHISRQAAQHRSASQSPRRGRMALPKLDTGYGQSDDLERVQSYGFGAALDLSRSRDASELLNGAIGPTTGRKGLRQPRSAIELTHINGSDVGQEDAEVSGVSWREIERAAALLYSSAIKAREIGRKAEDDAIPLPKFFVETLTPEERASHSTQPLRVKRREHYVLAARNIMRALDTYSSTFNERLTRFTTTVAPDWHRQLQMLEDTVENKMTPQIRTTADRAGELGMKLTTTSTLAVKGLNDSIEDAFRRRRRGPLRLVRRVWFVGIEWTVVGLLWLIWAVVSIIRVLLSSIHAVGKVGQWLLWIN
ncbi:hypothetical protein PV11_09552 [Exophiala sideris]|uniref:Uncharacterized protein n=1 Tax=Exophiala sideris TaxID=1016849 RepID=A0A0D1WRR8_9EURO|nr:hypothetical protein PV11_09552 [Exophiala sideris]